MIRVLIERDIVEGLEQPYQEAIIGMMQAIVRAPGYVSGESLRDAQNPHRHYILSSWQSAAAWRRWAGSNERRQALDAIRPFLATPECVTMLEPVR